MAGVKGRSGRRPWDREIDMRDLWNLAIPVLKRALGEKTDIDENKKIEIALALVQKFTPPVQPINNIHVGDKYDILTIIKEAQSEKANTPTSNRLSESLSV